MVKKTSAEGLSLTSEQFYDGTVTLQPTYRAFAYILWLTGCRENEAARMNQQDIYEKDGEMYYVINLSKLKKPKAHWNPLLMFSDDPWEKKMSDFVIQYWQGVEPGMPLFPWCKERDKHQSWLCKKTGEIHTGIVKVFETPYDRLVRSVEWQVYARKENGQVSDRKIPLHWIRSFVITNTLNRVSDDPIFTQMRIGHKNLATTMRYFTASRAEFLAKRERLRARSAPAPQPSPPSQEARLPSGTASTSDDGLPPS